MKKYIAGIIGALIIIVGIMAYLNMKNVQPLIALEQNAEFLVKESGKEVLTFNMEEIRKLGETDFKANYKKNGKDPIQYTYTGVPLNKILEKAGIALEEKTSLVASSVDGYTVAYDMKKVLEDDNIYLSYMKEGESLGNRDDGGSGPFLMVISKDKFSQNWCKYVVEVDIN